MISLEKAAKILLGKTDDDNDAKRRERGYRPKITLPRVNFLERELPSWWNEIPPRPTAAKPKRAGKRKVTP
jgi:hypothetical protein